MSKKNKLFILFILILLLYLYIIFRFEIRYYFASPVSFYNSEKLVYYNQTTGYYPNISNMFLNFSGECSKIFKYPKNSNRDLVIFSYQYIPSRKYKYINNMIHKIMDSFKFSIPNAKIIVLIPKSSENCNTIDVFKYYNIDVIPFENYENYHIVSSRFFMALEYLKKNIKKYDRIFLSDLNDVFLFNDIFATFSKDDLILNKECHDYNNKTGKHCHYLLECRSTKRWFYQSFGDDKQLIENFMKFRPENLNAGVILGGIEKMIKFLEIFTKNMDKTKINKFGYDQSLLNKYYYLHYFDSIPLNINGCSQRMCYKSNSMVYNKNATRVIFKEDTCSPVLLHKHYPTSWERGIVYKKDDFKNDL